MSPSIQVWGVGEKLVDDNVLMRSPVSQSVNRKVHLSVWVGGG